MKPPTKQRYGWPYRRFNPYGAREHIRITQQNTVEAMETVLTTAYDDVEGIAAEGKNAALIKVLSTAVIGDVERKDTRATTKMLDRILGRTPQQITITPAVIQKSDDVLDFTSFCRNASYPEPFTKQIEMKEFGLNTPGVKMILGSRGYGKTDYVVICGIAYELYLDHLESKKLGVAPELSFLLVTKSRNRNAAILEEVLKCATANGVPFEKESAAGLRVVGKLGKDHSLEAVTIGGGSMRGRHPTKAIMDDPVTEDDVSEATRAKAQRKYNEISKLTEDILIIGQPVHKWDLYETLRPLGGVAKLEVPHGSIPQLDHDLEAQLLAGVNVESISASYHLKVISEAGNPLEKVRYVDDFPDGGSVAFIDPSFEGGDYTAITCLRAYFGGIAIFGKIWKRDWFNCVDDIAKVIEQCDVKKLAFETNSLGEQPVVLLREMFDGVGIVGRRSNGSKHSRICAVGPYVDQIHIAKTSDHAYIQQIIKYEYKAKHDDAPDSLASGLAWIGLIKGKEK